LDIVQIPVIVRADYVFTIEQYQDCQFMHCNVNKWNKTVFKELKKDWFTFAELHGGPLYCAKEQDTPGYLKFIKALGFKYHMPVQGKTGNEIHIYYWSD
jgi:predicted DNA-binding ArsR family transcriptional regulator